ncbi:hypothetical protein [Nocardioides insulae]|uniref:hypothetical protein n=1 Tax=Nocardioides insulae TaxID=394734 RepID=UPI00040EA1D9|nr:hypothetical protein [Nocardioides insulae]
MQFLARSALFVLALGLAVLICPTPPAAARGLPAPTVTEASAAAPATLLARARGGSPTSAELDRMSPVARVRALVRCYEVSGETYCLGQGFRDGPPDHDALSRTVARTRAEREGSGALSFGTWLARRTAMSDADRIAAEEAELSSALAGAAKARAVRLARTATPAGIKEANAIMPRRQVRQVRSYWCGPATMQSIDWADDHGRESQASWAADLGAGSGGTSITAMVATINAKTGWDRKAGPYIVQSVSGWGPVEFYRVHKRHLGDADPAPIVEHPKLLKRYFPYLDHDHSGHYQPGRGYYRKADGTRMIRFFEVFNEADWSSVGRQTWGPRAVSSYAMLAATKANSSFQNIGL